MCDPKDVGSSPAFPVSDGGVAALGSRSRRICLLDPGGVSAVTANVQRIAWRSSGFYELPLVSAGCLRPAVS